jgi:phospholipase/carboxylesterase
VELIHAHYEPAGEGPHPTILALHGWGASALDLIALAPLLAGGRFQVLCPEGTLEVPLGEGAVGFGWFPLSGGGQFADQGAIAEAVGKLRAFLDAAAERYAIHPRKLVVLGFSQGGVLAYLLALAEPTRFAGLAALSSWLPPSLVEGLPRSEALQQLTTLIQHGTHDEIIAVPRARQSVEALRALAVPLTYREYPMGHEISGASLADLSTWLEEKILEPIILL